MSEPQPILSPRIRALQAQLDAGNAPLDAFWREVAGSGTPLFEPLPAEDPLARSHVLLTFLYRAADAGHVVVISDLGQLAQPDTMLMSRLPGSDLWHKSYRVRRDACGSYYFAPDVPLELPSPEQLAARLRQLRADPLNPDTIVQPIRKLGAEFRRSVFYGPDAPTARDWVRRPDVPAGETSEHAFCSSILGNQRAIWTYTPPGYTRDGDPYGLLVLFDGHDYVTQIPTPSILDNLIAAGRIPPLVAVLVDNAEGVRDRELTCAAPLLRFMARELVPWVRARYHVSLDPAQAVIGGASYGGLAAAWCALHLPYLFGNVLAQSGAFWWRPGSRWEESETDPEEFGWLTRQYVAAPLLPLRFYLEIGLREGSASVGMHRHLRDVLRARGYPVHYVEFYGGHDYACWRMTFGAALTALVGTE